MAVEAITDAINRWQSSDYRWQSRRLAVGLTPSSLLQLALLLRIQDSPEQSNYRRGTMADSTPLFDSYAIELETVLKETNDKLSDLESESNAEARKAVLRRIEMEIEEGDEIVSWRWGDAKKIILETVCFLETVCSLSRIPQIAQMELESASAGPSTKAALQTRVRAAKSELGRRREAIKAASARTDRHLLGLASGGGARSPSPSMRRDDGSLDAEQRQRLLTGTDKLSDGQRRLEDSHRVALETEDLGAEILTSLRGQRQQIEHTRDTVRLVSTPCSTCA
jgi:vesicle transport through interaction with t-SNAREs protein 1